MKGLSASVFSAVIFGSLGSAQLISVDFESDSSSDFTVVQSTDPDSTIDFMFDYVAAGIPLAPRSSGGDRFGLRMTANDTAGASNAITAFHNTAVAATTYSLLVDIWMNVAGTGGTTEMVHVGVGGDGTTLNQLFSPISGSGAFLSISGEGGSSSDYRWSDNGNPLPSGDLSYLTPENTTNASGSLYQSIFPTTDFPGSPGNSWTTLSIEVDGSEVSFALDGTPIILGNGTLPGDFVSLGYADLFTSIANPFQSQFGLYDNLEVRVDTGDPTIPEPAAAFSPFVLLGIMSLLLGLRNRSRQK